VSNAALRLDVDELDLEECERLANACLALGLRTQLIKDGWMDVFVDRDAAPMSASLAAVLEGLGTALWRHSEYRKVSLGGLLRMYDVPDDPEAA
jgi:hypothetical protein